MVYLFWRSWSIRHRLRPRSSAERRNPGRANSSASRFSSLHAVACRGLWMVGKSLGQNIALVRSPRSLAISVGTSLPFLDARHRPRVDHDHGRLDLYPFMLIMLLAAFRPCPRKFRKRRACRWRDALAGLLAHHLPADAAGCRSPPSFSGDLQAEAGRHRHQHDRRRPGGATIR